MKSCVSSRPRIQFRLTLSQLIIAACLLYRALAPAQDGTSKRNIPPAKESARTPKKRGRKPQQKLSGAELYALHCNRCHPERYAPERTADQWKTILLHMRTRANLPAEQARAILEFLQEGSGK